MKIKVQYDREGDNLGWIIFGIEADEDPNLGPGAQFERLFSWLDVNFGKIQVITSFYEPKGDWVHLIYRKVVPDVDLVETEGSPTVREGVQRAT